MKPMLKVLLISCIGGVVFDLLNIPIPWMLGPIIFVMVTQFIYKGELKWPHALGDFGVVIVGTVIGIQFNIALFGQMGHLLLYMILFNVILIGAAFIIAYFTSKWTHIPIKAAILGAIPGGLSQTVMFAVEENIKEIGIISYFQVIRLLLVVVTVPFIVAGQIVAKPAVDVSFPMSLIAILALTFTCAYVTRKLHLPVAFFITPIIVLIILQLSTPITMPVIPGYVMDIAQLLIGANIGLMLKPHMIKLPIRVLVGGVLSALTLIGVTIGSSYLMGYLLQTSFTSSFLSTAPGGLDQMVLLADAIHADVSLVSLFQTFRLLFIFMCVMPLMKLFFKKSTFLYETATLPKK